jgi:hypothetical protein
VQGLHAALALMLRETRRKVIQDLFAISFGETSVDKRGQLKNSSSASTGQQAAAQ